MLLHGAIVGCLPVSASAYEVPRKLLLAYFQLPFEQPGDGRLIDEDLPTGRDHRFCRCCFGSFYGNQMEKEVAPSFI